MEKLTPSASSVAPSGNGRPGSTVRVTPTSSCRWPLELKGPEGRRAASGLDRLDLQLGGELVTDDPLRAADQDGQRPAERLARAQLDDRAGQQPERLDVAQEGRIAVGNP